MMKAVITCFLVAVVHSTSAWVFPNKAFQKAASVASVTAAIAMSPLVANANADFNGSFNDPNHTNCQRVISAKGAVASMKGTDGIPGPGCPVDGSGKAWTLTGKISGDNILVDFSPKGGPPDLKGTWDATEPAGIRWPDGNKWTLNAN
jgi:hypothetical protein